MQPIFTVHAGEYLVASQLEKNYNVWIPTKDSGVDLLVSDKNNRKFASLQVKFSKDFNATHIKEALRVNIRNAGWWTLNRKKMVASKADLWVFVLYSFAMKSQDCIIVPPADLMKIFDATGRKGDMIHCYIRVTKHGTAFENRGLSDEDNKNIGEKKYSNPERDLTKYLNNWTSLERKLK